MKYITVSFQYPLPTAQFYYFQLKVFPAFTWEKHLRLKFYILYKVDMRLIQSILK